MLERIVNFPRLGIYSFILLIFATNIWLIVDLFMRIAAGAAYFNPQTCLLYFIYGSISIMIFFRVVRRKRILKLFEEILQYHETEHPEIYKKEKWILIFVLVYMFGESLTVILSLVPLTLTFLKWDAVEIAKRTIVFLLPVAWIILMPFSLENQYSVSCVILRKAFGKLNKQLDNLMREFDDKYFENDLKIFKENRNKLMDVVKLLNHEYGLELFLLSNTLLLVAVYVCNDVILMFSYMQMNNVLHLYKIGFNFYSAGGLACRLCWMCYETEQLTLKMKCTEKIILKYDINALPISAYIKMEKYLKQLHISPDETAICGFFHLNMEFVFNTFGTVIAFVVIFAQLNFSEKWIQ